MSKAVGSMVMHMTVDDSKVTPTINTMKQQLRDLNATWRANVDAAKAAGDSQEAARAKAEGLALAMAKQKEILDTMNAVMRNTGERTDANANAYDRMASSITRAEAQYRNLTNQEQAALVILDKQETGIDELNRSIKANDELTQTQIKSLKLQGDEYGANQLKVDSLKEKQQALQEVQQKEEQILQNIVNRSGETSRAYTEQAAAVQRAKNNIAENNEEIGKYNNKINDTSLKLKELKSSYNTLKEAQDSNITRLRAEGKENEANVADINKLKSAYASLSQQYQLQTSQMSSMRVNSDGFQKTYIEANKTATEMARVSKQALETQKKINEMNPYGISKIGTAFNDVSLASEKMQSKVVGAYQAIRRNAATIALTVGVAGAALLKGAETATEMQNSYVKTNNLLVTGGQTAVETTKQVSQMQSDGAKYATQYGYSQQKIADGYQELVKRGYDGAQSIGSMKSLMQAARATGDDYSDVVRNTTTALENFNLRSSDTATMMQNTKTVTNMMAYAADMTATDFQSLGKAMEYVGTSAYQSGFSLSETASAIGILSNNGLEADKAGTGLRKAISSLQAPTKTAQGALGELGLSTQDFIDKSGKMKSMTDIFSLLKEKTQALPQAEQGTIFHNLFGATGQMAGTILTNNAQALGELNDKVAQSADGQGYVATLAQKNMQTTKARLEQLQAILEKVAMSIGSAMLPALDEAAKKMEKAFNSKEGQEALKNTSKAIGDITLNTVKLFEFLGNHISELETFGKVMLAIWVVDKVGKYVAGIKNAIAITKELIETTKAFNAVNAFTGGGVATTGKSVASKAASGAESLAVTGASEVAGATRSGNLMKSMAATESRAASMTKTFGRMNLALAAVASATDLIGMTSKTVGSKIGESLGNLSGTLAGGALGAKIGLALGGPIGAGIGTAIGGGLGAFAGTELGKKIGKAIQKGLDEPKPKIHIIKPTNEETKINLSIDDQKIQKQTKELFKTFNKNFDVSFVVDSKSADAAKKKNDSVIDQMQKKVDSYYDNKENQTTKDLAGLIKSGNLTVSEAQKIADDVNKKDDAGRKQKKKVLDQMRQDNADYAQKVKDINNDSSLSEADRQKKLDKLHKVYVNTFAHDEIMMNASNTGSITKAANDQASILQQLISKRGKINISSLEATKKNANQEYNAATKPARDARDDIIDSAKKKYEGVLKYAKREKEAGTISSDTYDKIKNNAKKQKKETTDAAKEQYKEITSDAKKQHDAVIKELSNQYKEATTLSGKQKTGLGKDALEQRNIVTGHMTKQADSLIEQGKKQKEQVSKHSSQQKDNTTSDAKLQQTTVNKFGTIQKDQLSTAMEQQRKNVSDSADKQNKHVSDGFSTFWDGLKAIASIGLGHVTSPINVGISAINGLVHAFGGSKNAIPKLPTKFAKGTGFLNGGRNPILQPTLAMLNDGNDSPETGNREMIIHPNGKSELITGTNVIRQLEPGTEVLNATETKLIHQMQGINHFANGTGFLGSIWDGIKNGVSKFTKMFTFITDAVSNPVKTLKDTFSPSRDKDEGSVMNGLGDDVFYKTSVNQAQSWWKELWSMAKDSSNDGASAGNKGDDYPWKNVGKDSGSDPWGYFYRECVSFVASRLKNMGISSSLFSHLGNGADWVNAKVPHTNNPKPGDVAVYAAGSQFGNHVAMVTGVQGDKISGEEYNQDGDGKYHAYHGRSKSGATTFLNFGGHSDSSSTSSSGNTALQKLIKSQVGGMFDWIKKFIAPLNDESTGEDNSVQSWSDDVKRALSKLGLSTSGSMVSKVLRQIQTESGGNAKAIGGNDGLADGNATGLMQVKPGTFRAYALPGHDNIMNGYDNILAGLNYAKARYGSDLSFLGQGHGYANGGLITQHQIAEIGEGNQPEMIIPLSTIKDSRGYELLGRTAATMAARDNISAGNSSENSDKMAILLEQTNQTNQQILQVLMAILGQAQLANEPLSDIATRNIAKVVYNQIGRLTN